MDIAGQAAIVTGASRGLGRQVALALARAGMKVVLAARDEGRLFALAEEIRRGGGEALALPTDVTQWPQVEALAETARASFGPVAVLVNNAGVGWYKPFLESSLAELDATMDSSFRGTVYATRAVLPQMLERKRGHIVNVASDLGRKPLAGMAVYAAAKHAVLGFSQSLLREVKASGVKVTAVLPGIIDTDFGGGREGSREPTWSLDPRFVAERIVELLGWPEHWVADELTLHPLHQDF